MPSVLCKKVKCPMNVKSLFYGHMCSVSNDYAALTLDKTGKCNYMKLKKEAGFVAAPSANDKE